MNAAILIVDDERNVRITCRAALEGMFEVAEAESGAKALAMMLDRKFDVAVLDLRMPGMSGLELLEQMNHLAIRTPAVFVTAYADVPNAVTAMKLGAIDFLQKPVTPDELRAVVKDVLIRHAAEDRGTPGPIRFDDCLWRAKRAINLRDFTAARQNLIQALERDPDSPQALNLAGVMFEMRGEFDQARRYYGRAIKVNKNFEPAQANMRRIYELFHFGSSAEPYNLENR